MSIDVQGPGIDMSGRVAEEIRALLGRRRMSGRRLAQVLDVSPSWVSYRLTGTQPIDVNDMAQIASALGVRMIDLLPVEEVLEESGESLRKRRLQDLLPAPRRPADHPQATATTAHPSHPIIARAMTLNSDRTSRNQPPPGPRRTTLTGR